MKIVIGFWATIRYLNKLCNLEYVMGKMFYYNNTDNKYLATQLLLSQTFLPPDARLCNIM